MKDSALRYAEAGMPVFPLHFIKQDGNCSCMRGAICDAKGKHPRIKGWVDEASTDKEKIEQWWNNSPNANIGMPMGEKSGYVALDVDTRHDGHISLERLEIEKGELPTTITATTGSGGKHYLFKYTDKLLIKNAVNFRQGLDIRTQGGMIVVAPSVHQSGNKYKWDEGKSPKDIEAADMPDWLIEEIRKFGKPLQKKAPSKKIERKAVIEGGRNNFLTSLAGSLRRKGISEDGILSTLLSENKTQCNPPLDVDAVIKIAKSVSQYEPEVENDKEFALTDAGNAERFEAMFGAQIRYCKVHCKWFIWDGKRWEKDDDGKIINYAISCVRSIKPYADMLPEGDKRKEMLKHAIRSESSSRLKAMLEIAAGMNTLRIGANDFDKDPWLLNCKNGTINLKTGKMHEHNYKDYITSICGTHYDEKCATPLWNKLLETVTEGDEEYIDFMQRAFGYSLSGDINEQVMFVLYGYGSNGKSTLLNVICEAISGYAKTASSESIMLKKNESVNNDIAILRGARLVQSNEVEENKTLSVKTIKELTGGGSISARFLYGEFFEFMPTFKWFLACNHKPIIRDTTHSIWRRLKIMPFNATITEAERDKYLQSKIIDSELPGVLAWMVKGFKNWQEKGLDKMPSIVSKANDEYRSDMDTFSQFVQQMLISEDGARITHTAMRDAYLTWCEEIGERPMPSNKFTPKLKECGFEARRTGKTGGVVWHNVKIAGNATPL